MGLLGNIGRAVSSGIARAMGRRVRKHLAPIAPLIVTPVAIGAALSTGALVLFFHLAEDIRETDGVWRFDHDGLQFALRHRNPTRTTVMKTASTLARPDVMVWIGLLSLAISWRFPAHRSKGILLAVTLAGGGSIIGIIKSIFARERPTIIEALAKEKTFSFPSGHSFISLCFYGILASWWWRTRTDWFSRFAAALASGNAILLIGASRVYLGVHYPSDVLAGYAAATPWLTACLLAYNRYESRVKALPPGPGSEAVLPAFE